MVKEGDEAPDFTLKTDSNEDFTLSSLRGHLVVLAFYPKAATPGCQKEMCTFRDQFNDFVDVGAKVLGISSDPPEKQSKWKNKMAYQFPLLCDVNGEVRKAYGVQGNLFGLIPGRSTFLIDKDGKIVFVYTSQMDTAGHAKKMIEKIREVQAASSSSSPSS